MVRLRRASLRRNRCLALADGYPPPNHLLRQAHRNQRNVLSFIDTTFVKSRNWRNRNEFTLYPASEINACARRPRFHTRALSLIVLASTGAKYLVARRSWGRVDIEHDKEIPVSALCDLAMGANRLGAARHVLDPLAGPSNDRQHRHERKHGEAQTACAREQIPSDRSRRETRAE